MSSSARARAASQVREPVCPEVEIMERDSRREIVFGGIVVGMSVGGVMV